MPAKRDYASVADANPEDGSWAGVDFGARGCYAPTVPNRAARVVSPGRRAARRPDHQQPDSRADREARARRPGQGRDASARLARRAARGPGCRGAARLCPRQLRARCAGRAPLRERLAGRSLRARREQPAAGVRERRCHLPAFGLQPDGERVHRLHVPPRIREERALLHRARGTRGRQPRPAELHPAGLQRRRTSRSTTSSPSGRPPIRPRARSRARGASSIAAHTW